MAITPAYVRRESDRQCRRLRQRIGDDARRLRLDAGVTLTELSAITGVDRSHLRRIEAGTASPSLEVLTAIGVALGGDPSFRYFAGSGPRLVDRFQAPMIEGFIPLLHRRWSPRLEVHVGPARGVVDMALMDRAASLAVAGEFQSEFRRLEQQLRWANEKADGLASRLVEEADITLRDVSRLLVVRSTATTREVARRYEATLSVAYPARTADVVRSLTDSLPWPGPGIVWMRLDGSRAELLDGPPRGVRLGRLARRD
jgi:transcriptional regulator with XRE-family HTH domain